MKKYELWYTKEAPFGNEDFTIFQFGNDIPDDGWEKWSLPIGNGYMGVNIFGRVKTERMQVTENSLSNPYRACHAGLNNFAEVYIDFEHENVGNYRRGLCLNNAVCYTEYDYNGVHYKREYFTSYPDKVFVTRLSCDKKGGLSFILRPEIPFVKPYLFEEGDGMGKSGEVTVSADTITLGGEMEYYGIKYEGIVTVINDGGERLSGDKTIEIKNADSAVIIMAVGTNYKLESRVFTEKDDKKKLACYPHPHERVAKIIEDAKKYRFDELLKRHEDDYCPMIERANVDLGGVDECIPTDELLEEYKKGNFSRYLEELHFQFGRYLLISSSRPGTYPANLQGTWNKYDSSPWTSGYWHNINVQMNYWPAFNTNLIELFEPYAEYFKGYVPLAEELASEYIKEYFPEKYVDKQGENGWIIGTGAWLYTIFGMDKPFHGHSGPGTGAFTTKLFWDYYEFSMDKKILKDITYPAIHSMSKFLSKVMIPVEDKILVKYSASPEQVVKSDGNYSGEHYYTTGCAFDQQMVYENYNDTLKCAELLGESDELTEQIKSEIDRLDPVIIGKSGQVKEFREEEYYGDIGEYHHRHVSQLIGLYPETVINRNTPEWIKAAEVTLNKRGDESTGWSTAFKQNMWARAKNGNRALDLFKMLLSKCTAPNLWDMHPPFQIDGNFGASAGVAEMLVQSHEGYIDILPALPDEWKSGSFDGLTARGNFEISCEWEDKKIKKLQILSKSGEKCKIYVGNDYKKDFIKDGFIEFDTEIKGEYIFEFI